MRRLLLFFVFLLLPLSFAEQHESSSSPEVPAAFEDIDFTNAEQVNALPPSDLAMAIYQGRLTDLTVVNNDILEELVVYGDPSADIDGARLFQQEGSLLFAEVEKRGRCLNDCSESFLNSYVEVKEAWFAHFGIDDQRAEIRSYDGTFLTTEGDHSTQFNPRKVQAYLTQRSLKAAVLHTGSLVIEESTEIHKLYAPGDAGYMGVTIGENNPVRVEVVEDTLIVTNGVVDMDSEQVPSGIHFVVKPGSRLVVSGTTFESTQDFRVVTSMGNTYTVSGTAVKGTYDTFTTDDIPFVFTGSFEHRMISGTDTAFLLGGSTLSEYRYEESDHQKRLTPFFNIQVSESIQLFSGCVPANPHSCLSESDQPVSLSLVARDNNRIILTTTPEVRFLDIAPIDDESQVTVSLGGRGVRVSRAGTVQSYGSSDLRRLPEVRAFAAEDRFTLVKRGSISSCTATICQEIASAKGAGRKGNIVHVAAARLDGQLAVMEAARRNGLAFTGYEAANLDFQNVQEDLAAAEILSFSGHHLVDDLELWGEGGRMDLRGLPASESVQAVTFSACNTIKDPPDSVTKTLFQKYPNAKIIFGYNTKAPLYDGQVWKDALPQVQTAIETGDTRSLEQLVTQRGIVGYGEHGAQKLGMYLRTESGWKFCAPGGCHIVEPVVAAVSSESAGRID